MEGDGRWWFEEEVEAVWVDEVEVEEKGKMTFLLELLRWTQEEDICLGVLGSHWVKILG